MPQVALNEREWALARSFLFVEDAATKWENGLTAFE
jgi:hypothetical protein